VEGEYIKTFDKVIIKFIVDSNIFTVLLIYLIIISLI